VVSYDPNGKGHLLFPFSLHFIHIEYIEDNAWIKCGGVGRKKLFSPFSDFVLYLFCLFFIFYFLFFYFYFYFFFIFCFF